ncbi:hypothetical protein ACU635_50935 [[Actinomadura] parvosata]|uniref:hypothetical protein n=1 Tax=[Actinomadura] parvosata TaxID=1955412 RepID=UPI00406C6A84
MRRIPIRSLAKLANAWASPEVERPVWWRTLIGRDSWALLLITKGKPDDPPARPDFAPTPRLSVEWARRTGAGLTPAQLLHERISRHLRAHVQDEPEIDVAHAASIATDAAINVLAEYGVDVDALERAGGDA